MNNPDDGRPKGMEKLLGPLKDLKKLAADERLAFRSREEGAVEEVEQEDKKELGKILILWAADIGGVRFELRQQANGGDEGKEDHTLWRVEKHEKKLAT